jgi:hypothetical protein
MTERSIVIAALRQKNGNPDEAGGHIAAGREEERLVAKKRMMQRRVGKCSNGSDWVNLDLVSTLAGLLGFNLEHADHDDSSDSEIDTDGRDQESFSTSIVTGLLRLTNNDIEESLQLYNKIGAEKVFQRVEELDKLHGRRKRSRKDRMKNSTKQRVQDVNVAILESMGVEDSKAREALRATGHVEQLLFGDDDSDSPAAAAAAAAANDVGGTVDDPQSPMSNEDEALDVEELLKSVLENALGNSKNVENERLGIDLNDEWG